MDRLAAIQVFEQVVETGSFAKAAERLGLSTSAASRHIAELESHLQTRLLNRTTRKVSLTETGRAFYERSVQLLADLAEAEQEAARAAVEPRGTIRLTTSVNFGVRHVAPAIAEFLPLSQMFGVAIALLWRRPRRNCQVAQEHLARSS